ncbi:MAG TPA: nuclear transport factor 2 family protein [Thermoanaerobaculia bacterium]|nr:nuclear transport factor 2 family protein [Thermoanaerobaculia bacterium]
MRILSRGLLLVVLGAAPAAATDQADVMAPVYQFIDGFNKGDVKSAVAACADQASIIDEFAPYEWHGAAACPQWAAAFDADAKKNGITSGAVTLGKPRHVDITGDHAYVVVPTDYAFKQKGKSVKEKGSTLTVALQKEAAGWRITAWTWSKH